MFVRLRELRSNEALCRYDYITRKEDNPMSSLKDKTVTMAHGAGGRQTSELIDKIFAAHFANPDLTADDAAVLIPPAGKMAVSTDGFIVSPAFFPGGNIGKLSVCGTVNDLACMGAKPLYLTCAFVIEEGFPMEKLEEIAAAMEKTASEAGVYISYPATQRLQVKDRWTVYLLQRPEWGRLKMV